MKQTKFELITSNLQRKKTSYMQLLQKNKVSQEKNKILSGNKLSGNHFSFCRVDSQAKKCVFCP